MRTLDVIEAEIERLEARSDAPIRSVERLVALAEEAMESWLVAHDRAPTSDRREGSRLLALHHQAARGNPSFNACRETCRELVYAANCLAAAPAGADSTRHAQNAFAITRHLVLFLSAKLQVAGFGEFCCASKPIRAAGR
ncbi:MAG: hypothetical protein R3D57_20200 [Hyphomicrobiaceae bacterium]